MTSGTACRTEDDWTTHRPLDVMDTDKANETCEGVADDMTCFPKQAKLLEEGWTGTTTFVTRRSTFKAKEPITEKSCDERPKCPGPDVRKSDRSGDYRNGIQRENTIKFSKLLDIERMKPRANTSTLLEVCCQANNELCAEEHGWPHRKLIRIIARDDVATAKELQTACDAVLAQYAGHIVIFVAMPCTWALRPAMPTRALMFIGALTFPSS